MSITVGNDTCNIAFYSYFINDHWKVARAGAFEQPDGVRLIRCASYISSLQLHRIVGAFIGNAIFEVASNKITRLAEKLKWSPMFQIFPEKLEARWKMFPAEFYYVATTLAPPSNSSIREANRFINSHLELCGTITETVSTSAPEGKVLKFTVVRMNDNKYPASSHNVEKKAPS